MYLIKLLLFCLFFFGVLLFSFMLLLDWFYFIIIFVSIVVAVVVVVVLIIFIIIFVCVIACVYVYVYVYVYVCVCVCVTEREKRGLLFSFSSICSFVTPVVEHSLEREIAQWVHYREVDPTTHRTLSGRCTTELHLAPELGRTPTVDPFSGRLPVPTSAQQILCQRSLFGLWEDAYKRCLATNGKM